MKLGARVVSFIAISIVVAIMMFSPGANEDVSSSLSVDLSAVTGEDLQSSSQAQSTQTLGARSDDMQLNESQDLDQQQPLIEVETKTDVNAKGEKITIRIEKIVDENMVEKPLPPLESPIQVSLASKAPRIFNDAATMGITVTIGVLTAPALLRTRLIPLLESSLKYERDVHVFFMDDPKTLKGRNALRSYLESVNRTGDVHIALLPPPLSMTMSLRNAWVNLPAIKYFREQRPEQRWFAIMDDDTYFLMNAIRKILRDAELNTTLDDQPVYMGAPITDGIKGGCRVLRQGKTRRAIRTTTRKEVKFVCGGSGILFNQLVIRELHKKNATGFVQVDHCIDMMFAPAGDVRLGHCIAEMNISIVARREMFRDTLFRAVGEKQAYRRHLFPASFHRFRRREWQYALRSVEDARDRNELVTWDDLRKNFAPGPIYWRSMFFPKSYPNYTLIEGKKELTAKEIRRQILIAKRYNCTRGVNNDLW